MRIIIEPKITTSGTFLPEVTISWNGTVEYVPRKKALLLFASEAQQYHPKIDAVQKLVETFPTLFVDVDFYTEETYKKVMMYINPEFNVRFK